MVRGPLNIKPFNEKAHHEPSCEYELSIAPGEYPGAGLVGVQMHASCECVDRCWVTAASDGLQHLLHYDDRSKLYRAFNAPLPLLGGGATFGIKVTRPFGVSPRVAPQIVVIPDCDTELFGRPASGAGLAGEPALLPDELSGKPMSGAGLAGEPAPDELSGKPMSGAGLAGKPALLGEPALDELLGEPMSGAGEPAPDEPSRHSRDFYVRQFGARLPIPARIGCGIPYSADNVARISQTGALPAKCIFRFAI